MVPPDDLTREVFGNIGPVSRAVFYVLSAAAVTCAGYGVWRRARLWRLGRASTERVALGDVLRRLARTVLLQKTFGGVRGSANRAHRLLFGGFAVLLVGTVLIAVEHYGAAILGRDAHDPLFHKGIYFALYECALDTAGLAMLAGCAWFAVRRAKGRASVGRSTADVLVLAMLAAVGLTGYMTESVRILREATPQPGWSYVGYAGAQVMQRLGVAAKNTSAVHLVLWWMHTICALGLIAAFPFTRLMHSIAGAANLALGAKDATLGVMTPLSIESVEETGIVGVASITDFTRRQLLQLDACVSCGRCEDACPAHEAGRPLSPRDVVQGVKSHLEVVAPSLLDATQAGGQAPSLHGDSISAETLWSCTTCHACVDVCPLGVDPLGMISDMRRHQVGEGQLRGAPAGALSKLQRSGNPWGLPAADRTAWADGLDVPLVRDGGAYDVLYWVGCAAAYDRRLQRIARATAALLRHAGVRFAILGAEERCTGDWARRIGDEFLFQELAAGNVAELSRADPKKIVTHCPHCLNSLKRDYPPMGGTWEVVHHSEFLAELVQSGKLPPVTESSSRPMAGGPAFTYHDPCYLARVGGVTDAPRALLASIGVTGQNDRLREMPRCGRDTACCGAGGGRMWFDDAPDERIGRSRVAEALETGAETVVVGCPFCQTMLSDGVAASDAPSTNVKDVAEVLAEAIGMMPSAGRRRDG